MFGGCFCLIPILSRPSFLTSPSTVCQPISSNHRPVNAVEDPETLASAASASKEVFASKVKQDPSIPKPLHHTPRPHPPKALNQPLTAHHLPNDELSSSGASTPTHAAPRGAVDVDDSVGSHAVVVSESSSGASTPTSASMGAAAHPDVAAHRGGDARVGGWQSSQLRGHVRGGVGSAPGLGGRADAVGSVVGGQAAASAPAMAASITAASAAAIVGGSRVPPNPVGVPITGTLSRPLHKPVERAEKLEVVTEDAGEQAVRLR